jgi:hypothetical protein
MENSGQAKRETLSAKQRAFLKAFEIAGTVRSAAKAARSNVYRWRQESPTFEKAFQLSRNLACDSLVDEAARRALRGVQKIRFFAGKPIFDPSTGAAYTETEYSDVLLMFLINAMRPDEYRERRSRHVDGKSGVGQLAVLLMAPSPEVWEAMAAPQQEPLQVANPSSRSGNSRTQSENLEIHVRNSGRE